MGVSSSNSLTISWIVFVLTAFGIHNSIGIELCTEKIRQVCDCFYYPVFSVRCSHKSLSEYPDFNTIQNVVEKLDVSYNDLTKFPPRLLNFFALEILDVSHNRIDFISHDVILPNNLRHLILSYNNISDWLSLSPNSLLESAPNLETLNLAGNPLGAFNDKDDRLLLISSSLKKLDLSDCQIHKISGSLMLTGLVNLGHLSLNSNPLYQIGQSDLQANKLVHLDVSNCKLGILRPTVFSQMPALNFVNFSGNSRLSLVHRDGEYVESVSLRQIDLSKCNLNAVELKGFPNLTSANFHGNLITELFDNTFQNNILIENLDFSSNSINRISVMAFQWLKRLRSVDLSLNMIRKIEAETFEQNQQLTAINLSRNFFDRFRRFISQSLTFLNMSRCEITKIDDDALDDLLELIELDLSYNWFSELPQKFGAPFLQILDLSRCRLSHIENCTFANFPELSRLNLAGNRLTTTFRKQYFASNNYLNEIWLGDNPWRCECDKKSHEFYKYITDRPPRLKDPSQLRCYSPGDSYGVFWEMACFNYWVETPRRTSAFERAWTMLMAIVIVVSMIYSAIYGLRWWAQRRKEAREERQRQENLETTRELTRHNQMVLEQEGQLNAPDPRETHPPCYADAIKMPRPLSSLTSLKQANCSSNDSVNSIRRATKRCRSDGLLSVNGTSKNQRVILAVRPQNWILNSGGSSATTTGLVKDNSALATGSSQKSFEIINQLETKDGHSPYAKRKSHLNSETVTQIHSSCESLNEPIYANGDIVAAHSCYRSEISLTESEIPQTSHSFYASNEASYSTSSTSSFDSDEYYLGLYHHEERTSKQSEV
ncbi:protein artichoke [Sitodiplosis mosellana]|uniref:protein artichoke n=1 Tax=Sitodiplosis mosellana TaxID=263140 RepID=UPI002444FFA6|nr:protein artichoke [Sitodiplosis mosellana]XP_055298040.1 protein artichoke [Sitodiplosis mosellana]